MVEIITLTIHAAYFQQDIHLFLILYAFCDHPKSHEPRHAGDRLQDSDALPGALLIHSKKFHIQLQYVYRHVFEHIQRGIPISEIIHQHRKSCASKPLHYFCDDLVFFCICRLRNLNFQEFWRKGVFLY
ncbi:hypothetical protein SDC9_209466 [bioreactor metagenome]|uniref:Uncharacterized protein n=1 Tax=bioreactor metagenome TaxID=1076179 RepID=A0A645JN24_9ZZZZ